VWGVAIRACSREGDGRACYVLTDGMVVRFPHVEYDDDIGGPFARSRTSPSRTACWTTAWGRGDHGDDRNRPRVWRSLRAPDGTGPGEQAALRQMSDGLSRR